MAIESNLAGVVRVAYEAVTGEFNRDTEVAARNYVASNERMSDSSLKLEMAQDRLRRAVARGPAATREQQRALLALRQAEREVATEARNTTTQLDRQNRELTETRTRATAAGGALRSMRSGIMLATGGLLGTTGLVMGLRSVVSAADEAETAEGRLEVAYRNAGVELDRSTGSVERALAARSRLSAFDDEQLSDSLARVIVRTKDESEALEGLADITDIARGRKIELEAATQLWIKASMGQAGQLRRVGIEVDKNATAEQLLAKLRETYAGQAVRYANSEAAARERANISYENAREVIGRSLTPAIGDLARTTADWLDKQNQSGELQRRVNEAVKTGGEVVRGFAAGLRVVKSAAEPVVDALGGIEKAAQLALIVGIASKVRRAAGSFLPLQAASTATATKGVRDATVFSRAWDVATRPRTMLVTTVAGGVGGGAGGRGGRAPSTVAGRIGQYGNPLPGGGGGGSRIPFVIGFNAPTLIGAAVISADGASGARTRAYSPGAYPNVARLLAKLERGEPLDARERSAVSGFGGRSISELSPGQLATLNANLVGQSSGFGDRGRPNMGRAIDRPARTPARGGRGGGAGGGGGRRSMLDISTDLSRALTTAGTSDEERLYGEQIGRYRAQIGALERRKTLTNEQKQTLQRLYGELGSAQSALDSIEDMREQALEDRREAARQRAVERRRKAVLRDQAAARRLAVAGALGAAAGGLGAGMDGIFGAAGIGAGLGGVAGRRARGAAGSSTAADRPFTAADFHRLTNAFLNSLQGITNQFGANISSTVGGNSPTATHTWKTMKLMEEQNGLLYGLASGVRHPGAKYARTVMSESYGGVGAI